jgi:hypothetical protein
VFLFCRKSSRKAKIYCTSLRVSVGLVVDAPGARVGQQQVVSGQIVHDSGLVDAGGVVAPSVALHSLNPRLVHREPGFDAVAESLVGEIGVFCEPLHHQRVQPSAHVLQPLR